MFTSQIMATRIACGSPGCSRLILPATAARTGGLCMPCVQEKARRDNDAYIRANRRDANLYEGVDDPLELIKLKFSERQHDPMIRYLSCPRSDEDIYAALDAGNASALVTYASELLDNNPGKV